MTDATNIFAAGQADAVRSQCAALCWRPGRGGVEILLISSRETGRWVVPKGWPMRGRTDAASAAREAYEEAGVEGAVDPRSLGSYGYDKVVDRGEDWARRVPCIVALFPLMVTGLTDSFPEAGQRRRVWFIQAEAARLVAEADLAGLIKAFVPGDAARAVS